MSKASPVRKLFWGLDGQVNSLGDYLRIWYGGTGPYFLAEVAVPGYL